MNAIDEIASRIETKLKVTDAPGMDIRFTMNRDAAEAYVKMLRATSQMVKEHTRLRAALEAVRASKMPGESRAIAIRALDEQSMTGGKP